MSITKVGSSYNFIYNTKTGKLSTKDGSKLEFVSIRVRNELPTCYCLMHFLTAFSVRIVQNYLQ